MPQPLDDALRRLRANLIDPDRLVRAVAAGRRRGHPEPAPRRVELRPVDLKAGRRLLVAGWDGTQTTTSHHEPGEASAAAVDALLRQPYDSWHVETVDETVQLRVTKKGHAQVHRSAEGRAQRTVHDRVPRRLLGAEDELFRVIDAGADKRRQVEALLRALQPVLPEVSGSTTTVVDLGCGNAALTFATYRYLTVELGRRARLVGVDVKAQARRHNEALATRLGWSEDVTFVESSILAVDPTEALEGGPPPDVVLALHACDTATDEALAQAVRWRARVVLAAPCCHHDLQRQLAAGSPPQPYAPLVRHGIVRERFADVLTDALRAELLRLVGYRVDVQEFVGSRHTPRNTLIRAVRTDVAPDRQRCSDYLGLTADWTVRPRLEELLADLLAPVLGSG